MKTCSYCMPGERAPLRLCGVRNTLFCSREKGHSGEHAACGTEEGEHPIAIWKNEPPATSEIGGIYDTRDGRCTAALNVAGEHFQCELATRHDGWAHSSKAASAIWDGPQ